MRHSFATALITVVLDTYSHVVPGLMEKASKTMSKILEQEAKTKRK
jgi:hypothetical protein